MALLYGRIIEVMVAGLTIREPRISVSIQRQIDKTQNKGEVVIYNLSPEHEQQIEERGGPIQIQAGYPETVATLYEGSVQRVLRPREHLAKLTRIKLGDDLHSRQRLRGKFNRSYDGQVLVTQIITDIVRSMGLALGPLDVIPPPLTYSNFYFGGGPSAAALERICTYAGCTWWNDDGVIRINKPGALQPDSARTTISPKNGLIGIPTKTDEGADARMFLNPLIKVGGFLSIESRTVSGNWKIVGVDHEADSWEGPFTTAVDLRPV